MAMIIGGVTLDKDMIWENEFQFTPAAGTAERAIDGHMVVQSFKTVGGQPMTLVGGESFGWQTRSTVIALQALANNPGATFTVTLPDTRTFNVMFRVEEETVMLFQPIALASAPDANFWYYGTINLRIV